MDWHKSVKYLPLSLSRLIIDLRKEVITIWPKVEIGVQHTPLSPEERYLRAIRNNNCKSGAGVTIELLPNNTIKSSMKDKYGSCGSQGKPGNGTTSREVFVTQAFLQGEYQIVVQKYKYVMEADIMECNKRGKFGYLNPCSCSLA